MPHLSERTNLIDIELLSILVERIPIESVDKENELLRGKNRYSKLFSSYPPQADVSFPCHSSSIECASLH